MTRYSLYFAWVLSCVGVLASLYFSEARHLEPCHLCWYQRIFLYPLALILGIAAYQGDYRRIVHYTLPLAVLGLLFALYQVGIQQIPGWNPIDLCGAGPSCSDKIYVGLGFLTIPMLSALNFLLIAFFLITSWFRGVA
jgi:disulfide bond formation protein DsbB